jgi:hypothetical protein
MVEGIELILPRLRGANYRVTSPFDAEYNCIAWAAGDTSIWWWPEGNPRQNHWPSTVPRVVTLDAFRDAFATLSYAPCGGEEFEPGFEKVALFATPQGVPTHAARQLPNGRWTSKLGKSEDIEHALRDLEGDLYGTVVLVMRRPIGGAGSAPP